jgi:lysophospholipase L1-like esterase
MALRRVVIGVVGLLFLAGIVAFTLLSWYRSASHELDFFDSAIDDFVAADRENPPPPGSVVFVGSSSIRFWSSLAEDMAPLPVLNRGFGGSQMHHVAHAAPRIVIPYAPRAVVVYAGDNDLGSGTGRGPEDVVRDFLHLVEIIREADPATPIYFLAIKPSVLRFDRLSLFQSANAVIAELGAADPRLTYVDIATPMLDADGKPREDLFLFDGLHLSDEGYALWTSILRPILLRDLDG